MDAKPKIAFYISPHGFGHAARSVPVVEALKEHFDIHICAGSHHKEFFPSFDFRIIDHCHTVVQDDAFSINVEKTLCMLHAEFSNWASFTELERLFLSEIQPKFVISDAEFIPLAAAQILEVPSFVFSNFSWDLIYESFDSVEVDKHKQIIFEMKKIYSSAHTVFEYQGRLSSLHTSKIDIPLFGRISDASKSDLTKNVEHLTKKWVLCIFGGHQADTLVKRLTRINIPDNYIVFMSFNEVTGTKLLNNCFAVNNRDHILDYISASDVIVSKLGYGIVSEVLLHGKPLIYVKRNPPFVEEESLEKMLHNRGTALEISKYDFLNGNWQIKESHNTLSSFSPRSNEGVRIIVNSVLQIYQDIERRK
eukprot:NODE_13_length_54415_cov_0.522424.p15 type:complete len:364 gc:universal NODE_13_length_54415_cov_0.522424:25509-26600(+)